MSAPDAVTVYRTVGGEWRKTGNGAFTTHEYRALPAAQYAALVAERDALREKAERALNEVTCLRMSLRALSSLHPTHDVEYARTAAKRHEDNSWARYPVDAYGTALGAERAG